MYPLAWYKLGNKWYRNEVTKESYAHQFPEFIYLPQCTFSKMNKGCYEALRSVTTLQDVTGLYWPSASLCLAYNRTTQTEQPQDKQFY